VADMEPEQQIQSFFLHVQTGMGSLLVVFAKINNTITIV